MPAAFRLFYFALISSYLAAQGARADDAQVARGRYLVQLGSCTDCHTPGHRRGRPDMARFLAGGDVGFEAPGGDAFVPPNLTPDRETGLGDWTSAEIVTAIRTGVRPDGRILSPIMPWRNLSALTTLDALAIAAYLKSLPPVRNKIPGPFGPDETPAIAMMKIVLPEGAESRPIPDPPPPR